MTVTPKNGAAESPAPRRGAPAARAAAARREMPGPREASPGPSSSPVAATTRPVTEDAATAPGKAAKAMNRRGPRAAQTSLGGGRASSALPGDSTGPRTFVIELPAGMKLLSLNGREHWAERGRRTKELKLTTWALALNAKIPALDRVSVIVEYQPPDKRHRDAENTCAASGKACIDGIVAAGVLEDDECPRYVASILCRIGPVYPKGRLVLFVTEAPAETAAGAA